MEINNFIKYFFNSDVGDYIELHNFLKKFYPHKNVPKSFRLFIVFNDTKRIVEIDSKGNIIVDRYDKYNKGNRTNLISFTSLFYNHSIILDENYFKYKSSIRTRSYNHKSLDNIKPSLEGFVRKLKIKKMDAKHR